MLTSFSSFSHPVSFFLPCNVFLGGTSYARRDLSSWSPFFLLYAECSVLPWLLCTRNTYFFTRSVRLIFSTLFQRHILELSVHLWSAVRIAQVPLPNKPVPQMCFIGVFSKFKPVCWWIFFPPLLNAAFAMAIPDLISCVHLASCYRATQIFEISALSSS